MGIRNTKTKKKKTQPPFKTWLISKLRAATQKWPPYYETKKRAKLYVDITDAIKLNSNLWGIGAMCGGDEIYFYAKHEPHKGKRVVYKCEECKSIYLDRDYVVLKNGRKKKVNMFAVDHVNPVVDPAVGFVDWNTYISRMFPENIDGAFRVLCRDCHTQKTNEEKEKRNESN